MRFSKYHGLGNDYIVIHPAELKTKFDRDAIRLICHRNYGVGSDGILLGPLDTQIADFGLRIFNPDGSEADKSGNGLRIFARWIVDNGLSRSSNFTVETPGGVVACQVSPDRREVFVEMGHVSFESALIPVAGADREVVNETLIVEDKKLVFCAATVGNPHCIVLSEYPTPLVAERYGPIIEHHPLFPKRTNVQFMEILDRGSIRIEIWERGAGYTLASGSSSTAAAAAAHRVGLCDNQIIVHMPGGELEIQIADDYMATMRGPVRKICDGNIAGEMFRTVS